MNDSQEQCADEYASAEKLAADFGFSMKPWHYAGTCVLVGRDNQPLCVGTWGEVHLWICGYSVGRRDGSNLA